jgi:Flp pilus assembly secretin CpaC
MVKRRLPVAIVLCLGATAAAEGEWVVQVGETKSFALPRQPQIIGVEDPSIASMRVLPDGTARVTGLREGTTRIVGRDNAQVPIVIGVKVVAPPPPPAPGG